MAGTRRLKAGLAGLLVACAVGAACTSGGSDGAGGGGDTTTTTEPPRGGIARVAVWQEPNPNGQTITGAGVRSLLLPQLFRATPEGEWEPWLAEPGSDTDGPGDRSATFRLREGARWSDGSPITSDDLDRSVGDDIVSDIATDEDGLVTATFAQPLPGWRGLWSGAQSIDAPAPGVWGGPFLLDHYTEGLEAVLTPNERWWGSGPFLDEVHLILVPDDFTAFQLVEKGEIDVVTPRASTRRIAELDEVEGVSTDVGEGSGWWFGAHANPENLQPAQRAALLSIIDERTFVSTLLDGEAEVLDGFGAGDDVWAAPIPGDPADLGGLGAEIVFSDNDPTAHLIHKVIARTAPDSADLEAKTADADTVAGFGILGAYDLLIDWTVDDPDLCWRCRYAFSDRQLSLDADAGDPDAEIALQEKLRDDVRLLPLWRPTPMVAFRDGVVGPVANGWARIPAWNAETWHRPDTPEG